MLNKLKQAGSSEYLRCLIVSHGGWTREVPNVVYVKENAADFEDGFEVNNCSLSTVKIEKSQQHFKIGGDG